MGLTDRVQWSEQGERDEDELTSEAGPIDLAPRRYTLGAAGEIEIDCATYQLKRSGVLLPIEPKAFDVLRYLIEHRDRVVPSSELFAKFWPPHISASVLSHYIVAARKILGDDVERQSVIQTVRGRGYRFIGDVWEHGEHPPRESVVASLAALAPPSVPREWVDSDASVKLDEPFVGRASSMAALEAALDGALKGQGRVAAVTGEAGIGKTRVLSALSAQARARGALVLSCRCAGDQAAPAFRPWTQLLRGALASGLVDLDSAVLRPAARELAALVPELQQRFAANDKVAGDDELARFRLFDAVAMLLRELSRRQALVLSLDDLHAADPSSLALLAFLGNQLNGARILIACSYREQPAAQREGSLASALAAIVCHADCVRVELDRLGEDDVAAVMSGVMSERYDDSVVARVYALSSGNPFFVHELARWVSKHAARGTAVDLSAEPLPGSIRDAIAQSLAGASSGAREALRVLAVFGQPLHISLLAEVLGVSRDAALACADEAVSLAVVRETAAASGCYELNHALVHAAIEESMTGTQRARLHKALAEALERNPRADRYDALAHHLRKATPVADAQLAYRALQASLRSAERAYSQHAYEKCASECEQALALLELDVMVGVDELAGDRGIAFACDLALKLGQANTMAGRRHAARAAYSRAAEHARAIERVDLLAMAAIGLAGRYTWGNVNDASARNVLEEALDRLAATQHAELRVRVLGCLAGMTGSASARRQLAAEAMALTDGSALGMRRVRALIARHHALLGPDHIPERQTLTAELHQIAERSGDSMTLAWASYLSYIDGLSVGDVEGARYNVERFERLAQQLDRPIDAWLLNWARACRAHTFMQPSEAAAAIDIAIAGGDKLEHPGAVCMRVSWNVTRLLLRGAYDELPDLLGPIALTTPWVHRVMHALMAFGHADRGNVEAARTEIDAIGPLADVPRDEHWLTLMFFVGAASARLPDCTLAAQVYELLAPLSGRIVLDEMTFACTGPVDSVLMLLAAALGRMDDAASYGKRALELSARLPSRIHLATTQLGYAWVLVAGDPKEAQRARALVAEAVEHAESADSPYWADRGRALLAAHDL